MRKTTGLIFLIFVLLLSACSGKGEKESSYETADSEGESTEESKSHGISEAPKQDSATEEKQDGSENPENKMMIYQADIQLETDDYEKFTQDLDKKMNEYDAYMVETNIHKTEQGNRQGFIRLRVPQKHFQSLMTAFGEISDNLISKNVSGRDVTKEYVDLESRLAAKEKVESRLLTFLDQASATEDLIKISQDLERVQSDIESLKGQMNYLKNQSDFSTITLSITETKVVVPKVDQKQLNTWEKTKKAFNDSLNGILQFFSLITIFVIGYSPVLVILLGLAIIFWYIKKRRSMKNGNKDT
ncbi:DUF4349 domain-containing protein [Halobacillus yeomjeoni]|uniref:DUF4349 domain-containing protein n=1 Tax=Halobacillus yeomjeoni TaxID=311194 RepID=A0A931HT34_9BACI|nr:DUF4349 domain-containing protein [Halobacillus yeomjeoni]MBH0228761.1 DUF4349 domain-containing protein [Halobacillus yeomjeoni]